MCKNNITLFIDESGTPSIPNDMPWVVGGFAIRGNIIPILEKWAVNTLSHKKGRKYKGKDYIFLSEFIIKENIIPIASHCYLSKNDLSHLRIKMDELRIITKKMGQENNLSSVNYFWIMQVIFTVCLALYSIAMHIGKIEKVDISLDKFLSIEKYKNILKEGIKKFLSDPQRIYKNILTRFQNHTQYRNLVTNLSVEYEFIDINLNAKGKFGMLSDGICSLYKNKLLSIQVAQAAWHVIELKFKKGNQVPMFLGMNLNFELSKLTRRFWGERVEV
jgi:hypothetical protein